MSIFAIGDLHLSFSTDKPMDIFGTEWENHAERIGENWRKIITDDDTVLVVGDISWGMKYGDAITDLNWIEDLPGKKILIRGNHDLWWSSINKLRDRHKDLFFLQNDHIIAGGYTICGTRGWLCPGDMDFKEHDQKIYERELLRMRMSLESAANSDEASENDIIVAIHYPPTNGKKEESGFTEMFAEFGVSQVVYGHLHGHASYDMGPAGVRGGIRYSLVSADYLKLMPLKIT